MKFMLPSAIIMALSLNACQEKLESLNQAEIETIGKIVSWDKELSNIVGTDTPIEVLAKGFQWSEGPAWDPIRQQLYFSDVPQNKAFVWSDEKGLQTFLDPSGITPANIEGFREPGSNGLLMTPDGQLLIANHGKRAIELLNIETSAREIVINRYDGNRLNSPNDIAIAQDGTLFFTDPPYGLEGLNDSPMKEIEFSGIYQLSPNGTLTVIDESQTFPNGLALSPNEDALYVAVSDPNMPKIMRYFKTEDGSYGNGKLWFDAEPYLAKGWPGLPDGMVVTTDGHLFATGPGGVFILSPDGKALGQIQTDRATANCTLDENEETLFITAGDVLARVNLK